MMDKIVFRKTIKLLIVIKLLLRAEDAITPLLTDIEEEYQIAYLFLGEAANQVFRFLQKATGNHNYLYWTYGMLTAWDSSVGMLAIDE